MDPACKLRLAVNELNRRLDTIAEAEPTSETKIRTAILQRAVDAASERTTLHAADAIEQPLQVAPTPGRFIPGSRHYHADPEWLATANPVAIADAYENTETRMGFLR